MFDKKEIEILLSVADNPNKSIWTHSELTKTTYPHTHAVISKFIDNNILMSQRGKSRSKLISFTESGKSLVNPLRDYVRKTARYVKNENGKSKK